MGQTNKWLKNLIPEMKSQRRFTDFVKKETVIFASGGIIKISDLQIKKENFEYFQNMYKPIMKVLKKSLIIDKQNLRKIY